VYEELDFTKSAALFLCKLSVSNAFFSVGSASCRIVEFTLDSWMFE